MPELPDVEGSRRFLSAHAVGRTVRRIAAPAPDVVRNTTPQGLGRALSGRRVVRAVRHGKWLWTPTDGRARLVWHFGMTGGVVGAAVDAPRHRHDRLVIVLDDGEVRLRMSRKLGGVWIARDHRELAAITGPLGPDARGIGRREFADALRGAGSVKSALLDQRRLAGAGNLVADEVCWRARVHPRHPTAELTEEDVHGLHAALVDILEEAVPVACVPPRDDWLTGARAQSDPRCPRCRAALRRGRVAGRTTWWCPAEQDDR